MKIYLLRHGETEANSLGLMRGSTTDVLLSEKGIQQAKEVKLDSDFDIIFSSPMKRTLRTAEIINERLHKNIIIDKDLIERGKGVLEGKTMEEVKEYTMGAVSEEILYKSLEFDFSPYDGDSIEDIRKRIENFISKISKEYKDKKVLVVTHLGIIRAMFAMYEGLEPQTESTCAINILNIPD